jgi:hypothetical protein
VSQSRSVSCSIVDALLPCGCNTVLGRLVGACFCGCAYLHAPIFLCAHARARTCSWGKRACRRRLRQLAARARATASRLSPAATWVLLPAVHVFISPIILGDKQALSSKPVTVVLLRELPKGACPCVPHSTRAGFHRTSPRVKDRIKATVPALSHLGVACGVAGCARAERRPTRNCSPPLLPARAP